MYICEIATLGLNSIFYLIFKKIDSFVLSVLAFNISLYMIFFVSVCVVRSVL
jgi:hypothetical protein